jgi:hypothetical protein
MSRLILYLSVIAFCLGVLAFGGLEILFNWRVRPVLEKDRSLQTRYHSPFMADVDLLEKSALLPVPKTETPRDAGPVLNAKLFWSPLHERKFGLAKPIVEEATTEWFMRVGTDWVTFADKKRKIKTDLSFFSGLSAFDVWDIEKNSPIEDLIGAAKFVPPSKLPIPETSDLIAATKLRLIEGFYSKKPMEALMEVRQLANLLFTTENLELVLTGLAVLDHERRGYNYFVQQKILPATAWQPVERNVTRRAQRALLAAPSYLRVWTDPEMMTKSFVETTPPGFCAIVNEAFPLEYSLRPMLEPQLPFERDLRDGYARLDAVFAKAKSSCRLRYLSKLVETDMFAEVPGLFLLNRLPYSRKVFGMRLSTANFGGFEAYSQAEAQQSTASN